MTPHRLTATLAAAVMASACVPLDRPAPAVYALRTGDSIPRPPTLPEAVTLSVGRSPEGECPVLGAVAVTAYSGDDPLELLRLAASRVGADLVAEIQMVPTSSSISLSGVALGRCTGSR